MKVNNIKKFFSVTGWVYLITVILTGGPLSSTAQEKEGETEYSISVERGKHKFSYKSGSTFSSFSLDYRGKITLTDDERDIKSISPGGYFKVSKTTFGTRRMVKVENKGNNQLVRSYQVGRNNEPYYPEGQKWLADILPDIMRETGLGANQRVARIYKKSGTEGILDEIDLIKGDYVKAKYFAALLEIPGVRGGELPEILAAIGNEMNSSYEMGKLLSQYSERFLSDETSARLFFRTANQLSSDYEKSKLLINVLDNQKISAAAFTEALNAAGSISSDYESCKVLKSVLDNDNLGVDQLGEVMEIVGDISSDYEKSKVLLSVMDKAFDDNIFEAVLGTGKDISSDHEKAKVLKRLIDNQDLNERRLRAVLSTIDDISSDYEKKNILKKLIDDHEIDGENLNLLLDMVQDMSSSYEQSNIYKLIVEDIRLSDQNIVLLLGHVENLSSDHEKTNVLVKIAEQISGRDEKVKNAYMKAAKSINSDHSYGKVMRAFEY